MRGSRASASGRTLPGGDWRCSHPNQSPVPRVRTRKPPKSLAGRFRPLAAGTTLRSAPPTTSGSRQSRISLTPRGRSSAHPNWHPSPPARPAGRASQSWRQDAISREIRPPSCACITGSCAGSAAATPNHCSATPSSSRTSADRQPIGLSSAHGSRSATRDGADHPLGGRLDQQ